MNWSGIKLAVVFAGLVCPMPAGWAESAAAGPVRNGERVVLLHGLSRTARSLAGLARYLSTEGYQTRCVDYPSREMPIELLVEHHLAPSVSDWVGKDAPRLHFVTHSLGGILVRSYLARNYVANLGRVVMLSPPNGGSEVVDRLGDTRAFYWLNGPAGRQLGTDRAGIAERLPPVVFELGVITGSRSLNPLFSSFLPGEDDGKVSVTSARVAGMNDFLVVRHSHTFIMNAEDVHKQVVAFLSNGRFVRAAENEGMTIERPPPNIEGQADAEPAGPAADRGQ